ncbi:hypothetical protein QEN19_003737 [Hanseniaspora menglaensis]
MEQLTNNNTQKIEATLLDKETSQSKLKICCNNKTTPAAAKNPICSLFPLINSCQFNTFSKNYIPIFHDGIKANEELFVT